MEMLLAENICPARWCLDVGGDGGGLTAGEGLLQPGNTIRPGPGRTRPLALRLRVRATWMGQDDPVS